MGQEYTIASKATPLCFESHEALPFAAFMPCCLVALFSDLVKNNVGSRDV